MKMSDWVKSAKDDIVTLDAAKKRDLAAVIEVIEDVAKGLPASVEIDSQKTVQAAFDAMYRHASKHKAGSSYYMGPSETKRILSEYLGLSVPLPSEQPANALDFNLEDYL